MSTFRFEDFTIWQDSIDIADELFDIADEVNNERLFRFSEQLRGAAMSISNNIAEGSGSFSDKDFANFLVIARKSVFECANILVIFKRRKLITEERKESLFKRLSILSSQITNFRKQLI
ncbi:MAG: four helix bundle protein [Bacteroidales bacterium]|nr:four helix bundle protein [Bacteroidales bacterium]MDD3858578.1 four helix bundle protein [Bacteroidales bacterium]